jgi:GntR family transcriptional regulator
LFKVPRVAKFPKAAKSPKALKAQKAAKAKQIGRQEDTPLYQFVVKTLQAEIVRGIHPVGSPLPSEAQLVERFGVSRHTVREAVRVMREMRLVSSRQGFGTVVESPGFEQGYIHQVNAISDLFPLNVTTRYSVPSVPLCHLPVWAQIVPELDARSLWLYVEGDRVRDKQNVPFNEVEIFVASRFAGVGRVIGPRSGPIYSTIEMLYAEPIGEVKQTIGGFISDGARGRRINLKKGDAGIEARRIFRLASDNSIAFVSFNRYRIDDFSFSMTLHRVK